MSAEPTVMSLFAGAGGLDLGLEQAGWSVTDQVENWEPARKVLQKRFPTSRLAGDVAEFEPSSQPTLLAAGFPCVDVSHVGSGLGLDGLRSGLVSHVFRVAKSVQPEWILLENVSNLLSIGRGAAMRQITRELEALGYRWAYRLVDSRFAGVPQRRLRVLIVASKIHDPAFLLTSSAEPPEPHPEAAVGFYWTEGRTGTGVVRGAVPTLKAGSTIGLNSAPAIILAHAEGIAGVVTPSIEAQEVLQGFPPGWTDMGDAISDGDRSRLIGNAVTVGVASWIGDLILRRAGTDAIAGLSRTELDSAGRWPNAGMGSADESLEVAASTWPLLPAEPLSLDSIVRDYGGVPLSARATRGYLARVGSSSRGGGPTVKSALARHLALWETQAATGAVTAEIRGRVA